MNLIHGEWGLGPIPNLYSKKLIIIKLLNIDIFLIYIFNYFL